MSLSPFLSHNEEETSSWAKQYSEIVQAGNIIGLEGDLSAGKTTLIKFLCFHLNYKGEVTSPSYSLINEYYLSDKTIIHIDLYRLNDKVDWQEIGIDYYLNDDNICLIEWPSRYPNQNIFTQYINIKKPSSTQRTITVTDNTKR